MTFNGIKTILNPTLWGVTTSNFFAEQLRENGASDVVVKVTLTDQTSTLTDQTSVSDRKNARGLETDSVLATYEQYLAYSTSTGLTVNSALALPLQSVEQQELYIEALQASDGNAYGNITTISTIDVPPAIPSSQPSLSAMPSISSQPSSQPSFSAIPSITSQPSLEFCVPKDGNETACANASPTIGQGSCLGDKACVNTNEVQSIGIESCVGEIDPDGFGVCQNMNVYIEDGETISIGDNSWYVNFDVVSFLVCTFLFQSLTHI